MENDVNLVVGITGFVTLLLLPGAWVTFGLNLPNLSIWSKFLTGIALTPLIVNLQYYGIRMSGLSFQMTVLLLIVINLPASYLIYRQRHKASLPKKSVLAGVGLAMLVPVVALAPQLLFPEIRALTGHAWMHSDTIYMIANGELLPDDPMLVGVRQAYPWVGHVYQAFLSYLLDSPPSVNFIWTNIIWFWLAYGFTAGLVTEFGGNNFSKITSVIWLAFGLNFIGYLLHLGDYRYTPLLLKYVFFDQMPMAMGIFIALVFLMVKKWPQGLTTNVLIVIWLLLCSIGLIYPILFPSACAVVGAKVVALFFDRANAGLSTTNKKIISLGLVLGSAVGIFLVCFTFVFQDRVVSNSIQLNLTINFIRKVMDSIVAPTAFVASYSFIAWKYWKTKRDALIVTGLGALASLVAYMTILIPPVVEYKFMITAVLALAPFPALAMEPVLDRLGNKAVLVFMVIALVLSAPMARKMIKDWPWFEENSGQPKLDTQHFSLRLDDSEVYSGLYDAIRQRTSTDNILVLDYAEHNVPTLTRRRLFVPPSKEYYIGVNVSNDHLLNDLRGYDARILKERRLTLSLLFNSDTPPFDRQRALKHILSLGQPAALVLREQDHADLLNWFIQENHSHLIYQKDGFSLLVVDSDIKATTQPPQISHSVK